MLGVNPTLRLNIRLNDAGGIVIYGRPLIASGFDDLKQVGFAVIYPASRCSVIVAAGPDGIRGSTPHHISELEARTMPRVWPIPVTLFCHHVIITLAIEFLSLCVKRPLELRSGMFRRG